MIDSLIKTHRFVSSFYELHTEVEADCAFRTAEIKEELCRQLHNHIIKIETFERMYRARTKSYDELLKVFDEMKKCVQKIDDILGKGV